MRLRAFKPLRHVEGNNRGGVVWAVAGATATLRLQAETNIVHDYTVSTSLLPAGANTVGAPVVATVSGDGVESYAITAVRGGTFAPGDAPRDQVAAVAAGRFRPAVIRSDEGEHDWTA